MLFNEMSLLGKRVFSFIRFLPSLLLLGCFCSAMSLTRAWRFLSLQDVLSVASWLSQGSSERFHYTNSVSPYCVFSDVLWGMTSGKRFSHIGHIHRVSPLCEFSDVLWGMICGRKFSHIHYIYEVSLLCVSSDVL